MEYSVQLRSDKHLIYTDTAGQYSRSTTVTVDLAIASPLGGPTLIRPSQGDENAVFRSVDEQARRRVWR
jgi:hypothetical protein